MPAPGELACADCHSENPVVNNFGNIWSGRNAPALIERAIQSNTGGMGYFAAILKPADLADIAAYLGNAPRELVFALTPVLGRSEPQRIGIASASAGLLSLFLKTRGLTVAAATCTV